MTDISDVNSSLIEQAGNLAIHRTQDIPQEFLDQLRAEREASNAPSADMHKVASIPVALYESWLRQGYDVRKEPIKKTLAKLRAEGLDYFITTTKSI